MFLMEFIKYICVNLMIILNVTWLESSISLNHEWKIGGDAGNCHLV